MPIHSFVDESKDPSYLLVAALIRPAHLTPIRKVISGMVMPGQRRVHFHKERNSRKAQIIGQLLELPIEAVIYEAKSKVDEKVARRKCLSALVQDHVARDARRLVIERDESLDEFDRQYLRQEIRKHDASDRFSYEHLRAFQEPLLSVPDAIGWCWSRGDHWRVKAKHLIVAVHQV